MTAARAINKNEIDILAGAHHEAGHCVVALLLGLPVHELVFRWRHSWFGSHVILEGYAHIGDSSDTPDLAAPVTAAGPAAEAWWHHVNLGTSFAGCHRQMQRRNTGDAELLRVAILAGRLNERKVIARAVELVTDHWSTVARIAEAALAHQVLTGQQISQLI